MLNFIWTILVVAIISMASTSNQEGLPKPALFFCKKCNGEHVKPVGAKCERLKRDQEKRDNSRDSTKKTPKVKADNENSQEKTLDLVLNTMATLTQQLGAMDERISGLAQKIEPSNKASTRKSRSRDQTKRRTITELDEDMAVQSSQGTSATQASAGTLFTQTFPDTAVSFRSAQTPVQAKKSKCDGETGIAPLAGDTDSFTTPQVRSVQPLSTRVTQAWHHTEPEVPKDTRLVDQQSVEDNTQGIFQHVDQFGIPVRVQGVVNQGQSTRDTRVQGIERISADNTGQSMTLEALRSNPIIQQLVEERVAVMESRMRTELQQGVYKRKKSGRYNTSETPHGTPHLRWPNESCLTGPTRKRVPFDDLTLGQFVIGFVTNALDTQHPSLMRNMLLEMVETIKVAENISWPIAKGAFAACMHRIEDETLSWNDARTLSENRLTYSQAAVFSGSTTMSPKPANVASNSKKVVCKWFNEGTCPHAQDHLDTTGTTLFRHVCLYCFKFLKRNNVHVESECLNKKKATSE